MPYRNHRRNDFIALAIFLTSCFSSLTASPVSAQQLAPPWQSIQSSTGQAASLTSPNQQPAPPQTTATPHVDPQVKPAASTEAATKPAEAHLAEIESLKQTIAAAELEETTKKEALDRLKNATEWLKTATEAEKKTAEVTADIDSASADLSKAKQELSAPLAEPDFSLAADASLSDVKQRAADAEEKLKKATETLSNREDLQRRRSEYKLELTKLIAECAAKLAETKKVPQSGVDEANLAEAARLTETRMRHLALLRQETLYPLELKRIDARADLLPVLKDQAKREVAYYEKVVARWQEIVGTFRQRELDRQAAEIRQQLENAHPALQSLAQTNAHLSTQRKQLLEAIEKAEKEVQRSNQLASELQESFAKISERVEKVGQSTTIGLMLRREQDHLPDVSQCQGRLQFVQESLPTIHLAALNLQDERDSLSDLEAATAAFAGQIGVHLPPQESQKVTKMAAEFYATKRDLLDKLIGDYERYVNALTELEISQTKLLSQSDQFHNYIDRRVLWIRSSDPIWQLDKAELLTAITDLSSPASWLQVANTLRRRSTEKPLYVLLGSVALGLLLVLSHDLRRYTARIGAADEDTLRLHFAPTVKATLAFAIRSAVWPSLMWLAGWRLAAVRDLPELGQAICIALQTAAFPFWVVYAIRRLCRRDGVGVRHFNWNFDRMRAFRRNVTWLGLLGVPIVMYVTLIANLQEGAWNASLGRIAFLTGCVLLALVGHLIFRPASKLFQPAQQSDEKLSASLASTGEYSEPQAVAPLLRPLLYLLGVGIPTCLFLLAALGYDYTAERLAVRIQATVAVAMGVMLFRMLALRWLTVRCNRLRASAEKNQQEVAQATGSIALATATVPPSQAPAASPQTGLLPTSNNATASNLANATPISDGANNTEEQEEFATETVIDLTATEIERTDSQVRYVLRYAVAAMLLVGGYTIWSDITPALGVLDEVHLWSRFVDVKETVMDAEGLPKVMNIQKEMPITLKHAAIACVILMLGVTLARNIPAVFELLILERMPVDKGQRYAAGMILRYSITMAGVILACREIGLTWSSIQWLAAAMTVGLGFGLQEIFANLVSGLIILFERPIRVGDLVTAGGVTGRVTRMQIRATTITDFDRREMIVPNKKFITDDVMNWTLSDDVNRVVIEVGVAYGSDISRARQLLIRTAKRHPLVLDEPAPSATFDKFADSTLNLTLRCFLPNLDNRLDVIHELHATIDREFRQAKIEIAFPQQDLHVRSLDGTLLERVIQGQAKQKDAA